VTGKLVPLLPCHYVYTQQNCVANHQHFLKDPVNGETLKQEVKTLWGKSIWEGQRHKNENICIGVYWNTIGVAG